MRASTSFTTSLGTMTTPVLDTRYWLEKFQRGSGDPVESLRCFQISDAPSPLTLPSFMRMPQSGKFIDAANDAISSSVPYSWPPNSRLGKARMASLSGPYFSPSVSNSLYPRRVAPHLDATFVAYTTFPSRSLMEIADPSDRTPESE